MMLSVTKAIHDIAQKRFVFLLLEGAFPKVKYSQTGTWKSYSMFDYSDTWATFMKVLDKRMKEYGFDERLGIFTRKHSAPFLAGVVAILDHIEEYDVVSEEERFRSFADGVRDSI